jgi:hypothetical protein
MFLSKGIIIHMWWHKNGEWENKEVIVHPSYGDVWKARDNFDSEFAEDVRNVCIGMATDDYRPFGENKTS